MDPLEAISPIDGRYRKHTEPLAQYFSEQSLMYYRLRVEIDYLVAMSEHPETDLRNFTERELFFLKTLGSKLSLEDAKVIKKIEEEGYFNVPRTNHDVKAVEYFIKVWFEDTTLKDAKEWVHFALTSEDINNIAYGLMLSDSLNAVIIPTLEKLLQTLDDLACLFFKIPMLARTHEQPASPTTFGKEFRNFYARLKRQLDQLKAHEILVKLNDAVGNYNAHYAAYPNINWVEFSKKFIESFNQGRQNLKLKPNLLTTQIEPHDTYSELFDIIKRINNGLIKFDRDMSRYISDEWIIQKSIKEETGSSTMPHKTNPKDFENSEGNLILANAILGCFSQELPLSRLQRHLADSTIERNFGYAFSLCLIGYLATIRNLAKIDVSEIASCMALENHPEIISEAIQVILRKVGVEEPYEKMKALTKGKKVTIEEIHKFIDSLSLMPETVQELKSITPTNYLGIAPFLAIKND